MGKSTASIASTPVTSIICARYVLNADRRVFSGLGASADTALRWDDSSCWGPGVRRKGDSPGEATLPKGSGVPDWRGGKKGYERGGKEQSGGQCAWPFGEYGHGQERRGNEDEPFGEKSEKNWTEGGASGWPRVARRRP